MSVENHAVIEARDLLTLLLPAYPGLRTHVVDSADLWLGDAGEIRACSLFSAVADLVKDRFNAFQFEGTERLFNLVELCLVQGTQDVRDAAATCFLENLINRPDTSAIAVAYMGPKSVEYCRAWDRFTGITTPGLES